jgi:predicted dehydrogenase
MLAGKHVVYAKPLSISVAEAKELVALAAEESLRNYYPMVQQMRPVR